ncbi:6143_t:CDS:2 [Ambispora leptoticha]|uniref:DASH complex subunit DAD3 n=1 Tax=Ambispora leptoticha TaxID=144679 RepID=A0A9N9GBV6_9GLOM|nr:6143_t:CDS:2 [Ambispora leptoticha]
MTHLSTQQHHTVLFSKIENDVLIEYEKLASNVEQMKDLVTTMNTTDVPILNEKLRLLEKKMGVVYTLFKASVYSLVTAADNSTR